MKTAIAVLALALTLGACEKKNRLIDGPVVPPTPQALSAENVTGTWTGSYTLTYHTGASVTFPLTLVMNQARRGGVIDGNWNNGLDTLPLIGARATGSGAFVQAIGSNAPGSNPFRHYSYVVDARFTDSTFKTMTIEVKGNDFNGGIIGAGTGTITRP